MTRVTRITGVPGAGKSFMMTTEAFDAVDNDGYGWGDVRFVSFTGSHADDLRSDLIDRFRSWRDSPNESEREAFERMRWERVSTMHAWALAQTDVNPDDVIAFNDSSTAGPYHEFWRRQGINGSSTNSDPLRVLDEGRDTSLLGQIIGIEQWLALHTVSPTPQSVRWAPFDTDVDAGWLADRLMDWRNWKQENEWYEHHDYLRLAVESGAVPEEDVLLVDEMQDYAPLEFLCIQNWLESGEPDRIVVAGDPYQNIYGFKGARADYLTGIEADRSKNLDASRRCPSEIVGVARAVCRESGIKARSSGGDVAQESIRDPVDMAEVVRRLAKEHERDFNRFDPDADRQAVMVLARTNRHVGMVMQSLHQHGIPYSSLGGKTRRYWQDDGDHYPWTQGVCGIVRAIRALRAGEEPDESDAEAVLEVTPGRTPEYEEVDSLTDYIGTSAPDTILDRLHLDDREEQMVREALEHDLPIRPERVQVGTIHESKGREAPAVVLVAGYPTRLADRWRRDEEFREEERRVYYVAASRASEHLAVAYDFCGGSTMPLFRDGIPRAPQDKVIV